AHALGAALGLALARATGRSGRLALAAGVVAAAVDGDRVSRLARRVPRVWRSPAGHAGNRSAKLAGDAGSGSVKPTGDR
ncbi:hypothetical protein G3I54_16805, partial [Streptomyces sp. SID14515]|nr:hypothetical protein [Streptomyces sp. SID14515]